MKDTQIEWADHTINFYVGCTKVSEGCENCYMYRNESRWKRDPSIVRRTQWDNQLRLLKNSEPSRIFVNSMSDTFHESLTDDQVMRMFRVMSMYPQHTYMILTKRIKRAVRLLKGDVPENFWIGTSIESEKYSWRADELQKIDAKVHFISFEPLIERIEKVNLEHIEWMIVGGESGYQPRILEESWIDSLFQLAKTQGIPFFFKQWGNGMKKCKCHNAYGCRLYKGQTWDELPTRELLA